MVCETIADQEESTYLAPFEDNGWFCPVDSCDGVEHEAFEEYVDIDPELVARVVRKQHTPEEAPAHDVAVCTAVLADLPEQAVFAVLLAAVGLRMFVEAPSDEDDIP